MSLYFGFTGSLVGTAYRLQPGSNNPFALYPGTFIFTFTCYINACFSNTTRYKNSNGINQSPFPDPNAGTNQPDSARNNYPHDSPPWTLL